LCYYLTIKNIIAGYVIGVKHDQTLQRRNSMNQLNLQPYLIYEAMRYQKDIIRKVRQDNLVAELRKTANSQIHRESRILAFIGKELATLGSNLEARYGNPAERQAALVHQSNPGGCV
jgi:hypothetical protein